MTFLTSGLGGLSADQTAGLCAITPAEWAVLKTLVDGGSAPAEAGTLSGVPTSGTAGAALAVGGTFSLTNAPSSGATAYVGLFNATAGAYQGALQAVTGTSGSLPILTPAAAATYAVKLCADSAGATVLATSPNIMVVAAAVTPAAATAFTTALSASSGTTGSAVTLTATPTGAAWPSGVVLTPSATGLSGTFAPTTRTPSGTTAATFTFTPSAAGSGAIGVAANPSMIAPAGLAYQATVPTPVPTPTAITAASLASDGVTLTLTLSQAATIAGAATIAVNGVADAVTWATPGTASATRTGTLATAALTGDTITLSAGTGFTSPALGAAVGNVAVVNHSTVAPTQAPSGGTIAPDGTLSGLPATIVAGQPLSAVTYTPPQNTTTSVILHRVADNANEGLAWASSVLPGSTLNLLIPQNAGAYTVRAYAYPGPLSNPGAALLYESPQFTVTAAPGALPATPAQTADTGATSSSVTMNWSPTASSYHVLANRGAGSGAYGSLADVTVTANSFTFTGLAASSPARAVIIPVSVNGCGAPGLCFSSTTAAAAPASQPTGVTLSNATEMGMTLAWTAPSSGPTPTAYDIALSTDGGNTFVSQFRESGSPMLYSVLLNRLTPNTSYIARVTGVTGDISTGTLGAPSANSNALSTTATTSPPNTPTSFSGAPAGASAATAISLSWAGAVPPYVASATLTQRTPSGSGSFVPSSYSYNGAPFITARGLTPGSSYDFQLVLTNSVGSTPAVTLTNVSTAAS